MTDEQREQAIERIKAKRGFWTHLATYLIVNAFLVVVWAVGDSSSFWPIWPIAGWAVALAFHAYSVFIEKPISEDRIQREIDRES